TQAAGRHLSGGRGVVAAHQRPAPMLHQRPQPLNPYRAGPAHAQILADASAGRQPALFRRLVQGLTRTLYIVVPPAPQMAPMAGTGKGATPRQRLFGERVRNRRAELNMTQQHLAERAGLHLSYIGSLETGDRNPSLDTMARVAIALNCDVSDLVRGVQEAAGRKGSASELPAAHAEWPATRPTK